MIRLDLDDIWTIRANARLGGYDGHTIELSIRRSEGEVVQISLSTDNGHLGNAFIEVARSLNLTMAEAARAEELARIEKAAE